jgi:F-type H+-transporting ATPase subunit a
MDLLRLESSEVNIQPETLFTLGDWPITNAFVTEILIIGMLLVVSLVAVKSIKGIKNIGMFQTVMEMTVSAMLDFIEKITGNREVAYKILPIIGTLFIYIGISNLITIIIPFLTSITYNGVALFRTPTNDINATVALAGAMVILSHYLSIREFTFLGHLGKYFRIGPIFRGFTKSLGAGFIAIIEAFVGLLDLISEFAKVISLSLRLFGNMLAGELLIAVVMGLFAIALPVPLIFLALLTGILQAVVFGALTSSYISLAVKEG